MTLIHYLHVLRKRWLTVVSLCVLGVLLAAGATMLTPRVYAAQATAFVTSNGTGQADSLYQNSQFALNQVASYTELTQSTSVLQPVIDELKLDTTPGELASQVTATNTTGTVLIDIQAKSRTPALAAAIANGVAKQLGTTIEAIARPRGAVKVTTAVPASTPVSPVSPRPKVNIALGLLLGLVLGAGAAVLREQLDRTVRTVEDLQALAGVAPLGSIPFDASVKAQPLLAVRTDEFEVEALRSIRTNLQFVDVDRPPQLIVVTSAVSGEGKTVTACNLAVTLAQGARRVCLVEADLRRPKASSYMGLNGAIGLTNVLAGQYLLDDVLIPWNRGQVTVLSAGTTPPDPSHLLGSQAMRDLLDRLRSQFEIVIIDAPPLLSVSDAAVLSSTADGALLVVRYGSTRRDQVSAAIERLESAKATLIGTAMSFVPRAKVAERHGFAYDGSVDGSVVPESSLSTAEQHARERQQTARVLDSSTDELAEPPVEWADDATASGGTSTRAAKHRR